MVCSHENDEKSPVFLKKNAGIYDLFFRCSPSRILVQAEMVSWKEDAMKNLRTKWMNAVITAALMLSAGICYSCSRREEGGFYGIEEQEWAEPAEGDRSSAVPSSAPEPVSGPEETSGTTGPEEEEEQPLCWVHICGAVQNPGVYGLEEGSRIYQAVEAAGGFLPEADEEYLNLAAAVADGMKITVLTEEEAHTAPFVAEAGGMSSLPDHDDRKKVNINTADKDELMTLKGIGEARAEDIIAYRRENGPFRSIEEIMKVSGIKEAAFAEIQDEITV